MDDHSDVNDEVYRQLILAGEEKFVYWLHDYKFYCGHGGVYFRILSECTVVVLFSKLGIDWRY